MTTNQINEIADKLRYLVVKNSAGNQSMRVAVNILDTRTQFGRVDTLIEPIAGQGSIWVSMDSLSE